MSAGRESDTRLTKEDVEAVRDACKLLSGTIADEETYRRENIAGDPR